MSITKSGIQASIWGWEAIWSKPLQQPPAVPISPSKKLPKIKLQILDTVLFAGNKPYRWLFTAAKSGEVKKHKDETTNHLAIKQHFAAFAISYAASERAALPFSSNKGLACCYRQDGSVIIIKGDVDWGHRLLNIPPQEPEIVAIRPVVPHVKVAMIEASFQRTDMGEVNVKCMKVVPERLKLDMSGGGEAAAGGNINENEDDSERCIAATSFVKIQNRNHRFNERIAEMAQQLVKDLEHVCHMMIKSIRVMYMCMDDEHSAVPVIWFERVTMVELLRRGAVACSYSPHIPSSLRESFSGMSSFSEMSSSAALTMPAGGMHAPHSADSSARSHHPPHHSHSQSLPSMGTTIKEQGRGRLSHHTLCECRGDFCCYYSDEEGMLIDQDKRGQRQLEGGSCVSSLKNPNNRQRVSMASELIQYKSILAAKIEGRQKAQMSRIWDERLQHFWSSLGPATRSRSRRGEHDDGGDADNDSEGDEDEEEELSLERLEPIRFYKEVKVCAKCHSVYSRLDRARRTYEERKYLVYPESDGRRSTTIGRVGQEKKVVGENSLPPVRRHQQQQHSKQRQVAKSKAEFLRRGFVATQSSLNPLSVLEQDSRRNASQAALVKSNSSQVPRREAALQQQKQQHLLKERKGTKFYVTEDKASTFIKRVREGSALSLKPSPYASSNLVLSKHSSAAPTTSPPTAAACSSNSLFSLHQSKMTLDPRAMTLPRKEFMKLLQLRGGVESMQMKPSHRCLPSSGPDERDDKSEARSIISHGGGDTTTKDDKTLDRFFHPWQRQLAEEKRKRAKQNVGRRLVVGNKPSFCSNESLSNGPHSASSPPSNHRIGPQHHSQDNQGKKEGFAPHSRHSYSLDEPDSTTVTATGWVTLNTNAFANINLEDENNTNYEEEEEDDDDDSDNDKDDVYDFNHTANSSTTMKNAFQQPRHQHERIAVTQEQSREDNLSGRSDSSSNSSSSSSGIAWVPGGGLYWGSST